MTPPTVGLSLIARNEAENLPRLLRSIEGAFDRVVLLDTGSTDDTVEVFSSWALRQETDGWGFDVAEFEWCDDFAAARIAADRLLYTGTTEDLAEPVVALCDVGCWADCDDTIEGAQNLRGLAASMPSSVAALIADYIYARDHLGNVVCTLKRERLVRAGHGEWVGRVHEAQLIHNGACMPVDPRTVKWVHHKGPDAAPSSPRNLRILRAWVKEEPENPRVLAYLGTEEAAMGRHKRALGFFRRYLKTPADWDDERAQVHRKLVSCLIALDRAEEAMTVALDAFRVHPGWTDNFLSMAEACYSLGEHEKAIHWAKEVLRRGQPDTLLILGPLDYVLQPRVVLAGALGALGRIEEAVEVASEALRIMPDHGDLQRAMAHWRSVLKREQTAQTWAACAETLIEHDEQAKALVVLEQTVPYYADEHPRIVGVRSQLRERLAWVDDPDAYAHHYETGGSKEEDMVPDEDIVPLCEGLPRVQALVRGLREIANEGKVAA